VKLPSDIVQFLQKYTDLVGKTLDAFFRETVIGEFDAFVKPVRHPLLSDFCRKLTGMRQEDVDGANGFVDVFERFCVWLHSHFRRVLFCSWSSFDRQQLLQDCTYHGIPYPFREHLDLYQLFRNKTGRKMGHRKAMKVFGLKPHGPHHRGIYDAKNIAAMLPFLLKPSR